MTTSMEPLFTWLWRHKPQIAIIATVLTITVVVTVKVNNFLNHLGTVKQNSIENLDEVKNLERKVNENSIDIKSLEMKVNQNSIDINNLEMKMEKKFELVDQRFQEIDQRFDKLEGEMVEMKLILKRIDTYLGTKDKNYPSGE